MKKLFSFIIVLILLIYVKPTQPIKSEYRTTQVVATSHNGNDTVFEDEEGNLWVVSDYYSDSCTYSLLLDNNGTYNLEDDVVVEVTVIIG